MSLAELRTRLFDRYDNFTNLVNRDFLYLQVAMLGLQDRLQVEGLTEEEAQDERYKAAYEWVLERGPDRVSKAIAVGLWSAFETFLEDIFVLVCSELDVEASKLPRARIAIAEFMGLTDDERWRVVWNRAEGESAAEGVKLCDDVFGRMGYRVDLARNPSVPTEVALDNASARQLLRELEALRNVIIHGGEIADRRLEERSGQRYRTGEQILLDFGRVHDYGRAVHAYAAALGAAVGEFDEPPARPGSDER